MKIVIFVDGGVVTSVLHSAVSGETVDVLVVDYDNGNDLTPEDDGYMEIEFDEGDTERAQAGTIEAESDPEFVDRLFRQYWDNK